MDITDVLHGFELPNDHPRWESDLLRQLASLPSDRQEEPPRPISINPPEGMGIVLSFRRPRAA